jgi:hypothetical protein
MIQSVDKIRFLDTNGREVFSVCNASLAIGTITIGSGPPNNSIVTEAVRRTVREYGETLRQLSNE